MGWNLRVPRNPSPAWKRAFRDRIERFRQAIYVGEAIEQEIATQSLLPSEPNENYCTL